MSEQPSSDDERRVLVRHLFDEHGVWLMSGELRRTSTQDLRKFDPCSRGDQ